MNFHNLLASVDPEIYDSIARELERQRTKLVLIASENFTSSAVMAAEGGIMTNKYAEGYPGNRYYGGCEFVDEVERLAVKRACRLFQADHANVQPHSGSQANMAVYFSVLKPGDTILGMNLAHGGHLTHGSPVSFSGRLFNIVSYGLRRDDGMIDMDEVARLAEEHEPKLILAGASAYSRTIDFKAFSSIAKKVGALFMVDMAHIAGLVAAGIHPSPVPEADFITATTHKTLRGPRGGMILTGEEQRRKLNSSIFPGIQGGPLMHVIAAKAVAFKEALSPDFKIYQEQIVKNAARLAENLMADGFKLVSNGTDNHLLLVDLSDKGITGLQAEQTLDRAGITTNKNAVPFDKQPPKVTSGLRLGTPALTTRGMKEAEMDVIAGMIGDVLKQPENDNLINKVREGVKELCKRFPLYPEFGEM